MFGFPADFFSMQNPGNRRANTANALVPHHQGLFGNSLMMPMPFMSSPFGGTNNLFDSFGLNTSPFAMMDRMMRSANDSLLLGGSTNSSAPMHSFTSTTVMSYSGSDGRPKVYQESTSRSRGPGGLEETRQAIRDSERGINKVQIGHRIGDRKHVIEREMNVETGQISENVELENLDEEETDQFKKEWRERSGRTSLHRRSHHHLHPQLDSRRTYHPATDSPQRAPLAIEHHSATGASSRSQPKATRHSSHASQRGPTVHPSDTIDLTDDTPNDDDVKEIEQLPSTQGGTSMKRKASWSSPNDANSQRKHRQH